MYIYRRIYIINQSIYLLIIYPVAISISNDHIVVLKYYFSFENKKQVFTEKYAR